MEATAKQPIPLATEAYIANLTFLMKDEPLLIFIKNGIVADLEKVVAGKLDYRFMRLGKRLREKGSKVAWRYDFSLRNVTQEMLEALKPHSEKYEFLPYSIDLVLNHLAATRGDALEMGRFISGYLVQPRNSDLMVAVYPREKGRIYAGENVAYQDTPDDLLYFSTKRMKLKQSWDGEYTLRKPNLEITINPHASSRTGQPCCSTRLTLHGSHEIKKQGASTLDHFKRLDMRNLWGKLLMLAEVDDDTLIAHVQKKEKGNMDSARRRINVLKRSSMLELDGVEFLSTHNLRVQSGLRLGACRLIDAGPYLPVKGAAW